MQSQSGIWDKNSSTQLKIFSQHTHTPPITHIYTHVRMQTDTQSLRKYSGLSSPNMDEGRPVAFARIEFNRFCKSIFVPLKSLKRLTLVPFYLRKLLTLAKNQTLLSVLRLLDT